MDELRIMIEEERGSRMAVAGVGEIIVKECQEWHLPHLPRASGSRENDAASAPLSIRRSKHLPTYESIRRITDGSGRVQ